MNVDSSTGVTSRPMNASVKHGRRIGRRRMLGVTGAAAFGLPVAFGRQQVLAADSPAPMNRFPQMVHEYFVEQVRAASHRHRQAYARLKTREDAEVFVQTVRTKIRQCFGPEPERTDLKARVTGRVDRDVYTIEKVIFESRPGFPVTANLYLPKGAERPRPGVIGTCGHSSNGKAAEPYQSFAQGLARLGYVCLIYDPIGQGERFQYVNDDLKARFGPGVREHIQAGNQQFLVGEFLGMWRAWDGIRALDYLLTRKEVDPKHLGVTGNSGGGTMTTWLCGVEPRWTMAAPSCFVTMFRRNMENELPADTEQCPPKALSLGLDHCDFIAAMAPKPVILLTKERDYFDVRGGLEAVGRLKHLYRLLGAENNISLFTGPTTHGYSQENREAMYRWFNRATQLTDARSEPKITIEKDETLSCTPRGQVSAEPGTLTVFDFTSTRARQFIENRPAAEGAALAQAIEKVLHVYPPTAPRQPDREDVPEYRILRSRRTRAYPKPYTCTYAVETEPGVMAAVYMLGKESWYSRPPRTGPKATLYVAHRSSDIELQGGPLNDLLKAELDSNLFACDVRGIGESMPNTCGSNSFDNPYGCDFFYSIHSLMLDRPYLGQKTFDLLRVLDWLNGHGYQQIHLIARGWGALAGTFAAVLSDRVRQVTLINSLTSYSDVATTEDYSWPLATIVPDILEHFDLPDCYRALKAKKLRQVDPWGATDGKKK